MNTDELLTRLLDAVHTAATDSAKPGHAEIAERLEAQLRAELALLRPLAEAAVAYYELLNDGRRMTEAKENDLDRSVDHMAITGEAYAAARAQAQAGEGA